MKKLFKKKLTILTLISISLIACEPSPEKVQEYLSTDNYEQLYNYFQNATDKSISIVGYQDPTLFEKVMHSLIFNPSDYSAKTISRISPKSKNWALSITKVAIDSSYNIPEGLHEVVYTAYKDQRVVVIGKEKIEQLIKSDNGFKPLLIEEIKESLNTSFSTTKITILANLASIELPKDIIKRISEIPDEIADIKRQENDDYQLTTKLKRERFLVQRELSNLNSNTDYKVVKALVEESYFFEGYMVAYIDDIATGEVYEVMDLSRNLYLLNTVETSFTSKGFFKLRVLKSGLEIPMTLRDGGFKKDIPLITEVNSEVVKDYRSNKNQYDQLLAKIDNIDRQIAQKEQLRKKNPEEYELLAKQKRNELDSKKNELKTWILNELRS